MGEENFEEAFERTTTTFGNSCHVILPKEYEDEKIVVLVGCQHDFKGFAKGKAYSNTKGHHIYNLFKCKKCGKIINKQENK